MSLQSWLTLAIGILLGALPMFCAGAAQAQAGITRAGITRIATRAATSDYDAFKLDKAMDALAFDNARLKQEEEEISRQKAVLEKAAENAHRYRPIAMKRYSDLAKKHVAPDSADGKEMHKLADWLKRESQMGVYIATQLSDLDNQLDYLKMKQEDALADIDQAKSTLARDNFATQRIKARLDSTQSIPSAITFPRSLVPRF